ncbi:MAG: type II toxin-antitoxin system RelE/ParE family toxin [Candidatus Gottesmanbacteria bacterium]|nr:type II toxin-antitoxin system RelE/ParE family toxin [Candidatus Gottesmanbacteria bacterium]
MKLVLKDEAVKRLKRIGGTDKIKAKRKIYSLLSDPFQGKMLVGKLKGFRSVKAWPLRIVYTFDPVDQIIQIETIDYRGSVYKN